MAFGIDVVLLYIGGAAGLGLAALIIYGVRAKYQTKVNQERLRRLRRTLQQTS